MKKNKKQKNKNTKQISRTESTKNKGWKNNLFFFFAPSARCAFGAPLPTGSPLHLARRPTHDWIDIAPIHIYL